MSTGEILVIGLLIAGVCGAVCASIASGKGLDATVWFILGALLGVLGVLVVACMRPAVRPGWYPCPDGWVRWWDGRQWL